jgi:hypothetical protein
MTAERLVVGRVRAAARVARMARVAAPAPWVMVVKPRRRLVDLGRLADYAPGEVEQVRDRDNRREENRPEIHCWTQCSPLRPT